MFIVALFFGLYSYLIFSLGLLGFLYKPVIIILTISLAGLLLFWQMRLRKKYLSVSFVQIFKKKGLLFTFLLFIFLVQAVVNLIGALGPELGFDALWYHLTLPKLYLTNHEIFFIPGGLLYYSGMPKLAEMLYVAGLSFGNESIPKLIHFSFGLLICLALYKIERKFLNSLMAMVGVVIFYSNLVIAWESSSAYVDLVRTFFEIMAVWGLINWLESKRDKWLFISALMLGFEISTKLQAVGSLFVFLLLIMYSCFKQGRGLKKTVSLGSIYAFIVFIIPLPWLLFAYANTGNPFYPLFSQYLIHLNDKLFDIALLSPLHFMQTSWDVLTRAADPISPLYLIFLPLLIIFYKKATYKYLFVYALLGFFVWYFTSAIEGARMLMPYLPVFSLLVAGTIDYIYKQRKLYGALFIKGIFFLVIVTLLLSIGYRAVANKKYLPLIAGQETRAFFLTNHLNFSFGDFYDTDGYFAQKIKSTDTVLLLGFHNLYYVDFPFIDGSWVKKGDTYNYVAIQKANLPTEYEDWKLVYQNDKTMVKLYKKE